MNCEEFILFKVSSSGSGPSGASPRRDPMRLPGSLGRGSPLGFRSARLVDNAAVVRQTHSVPPVPPSAPGQRRAEVRRSLANQFSCRGHPPQVVPDGVVAEDSLRGLECLEACFSELGQRRWVAVPPGDRHDHVTAGNRGGCNGSRVSLGALAARFVGSSKSPSPCALGRLVELPAEALAVVVDIWRDSGSPSLWCLSVVFGSPVELLGFVPPDLSVARRTPLLLSDIIVEVVGCC